MNTPDQKSVPLDWNVAEYHLEEVERAYRRLVGLSGVNASFMFGVLDRIRARFNTHERTPKLHAEIMALKE